MAKFTEEELGIIAIILDEEKKQFTPRENENGRMRHGKKEMVKESPSHSTKN